jgi:hypothetical protein
MRSPDRLTLPNLRDPEVRHALVATGHFDLGLTNTSVAQAGLRMTLPRRTRAAVLRPAVFPMREGSRSAPEDLVGRPLGSR